MIFAVLLIAALLAPAPAHAGPVVAAIGMIGQAITAFAAQSTFTAFLVKTATSIVLSKLAQALSRKKAPRAPGIQTDVTTSGGTTPQKFILGRYATGGQLIAPPNSYGQAGDTPRAWLVYPIALSVVPGCTMERVIIDDQYMTWAGAAGASWGVPATGDLAGYVWVDYEDGSQVAAHPDMRAAFGADPDRPWLADMVGPGTCYAVVRFKYNRERFNSLPSVRIEMLGIPLYDPRADSSVGGSGLQRWANRATWAQSANPVVMIYNILRGIDVGAGMVWGGECAAEDLPLANWFAAMNECDMAVALAAGSTEPQYRAGIEVALDNEPASIIEELMKCCSASIVEVGGVWKIRVGAPALPGYFITDDDVVVSQDQEFDEFPGLGSTVNGISATYPDPASLWEQHEAPPRYNPAWEAADGNRRLVADLDLPACPYPMQVQRLMASLVADHRRFRTHKMALPPEAMELEPLETIGWTSARHGYSAKVFEITAITDSLTTLIQGVSIRERDAGDYAWTPGDELPSTPAQPGTTPPPPRVVPGFDAQPDAILDAGGASRRPAILISWDPAQAIDARGILWEVRRSGTLGPKISGSLNAIEAGQLRITDGLLPATDYEVRACLILDRPVIWTDWKAVTTPGTYITDPDFGPTGVSGLFKAAGLSAPRIVAVLPSAGPTRFVGELVFLTSDLKLYRWTGSAWTAAVPTTDLTGKVASSQLLIADLSNLCENPGFEQNTAGWGAVGGINGYSVISTDAMTGSRCAARVWASGFAANAAYRNNLVFETAPGRTYRVSAQVKRNAGGVCTSVGVRLAWLDAAGTEIGTTAASLTQAETSTAWTPVTNMVTAPAGAVQARVELVVIGHTAGTFYWDDVYCYRANAGELMVDGTIFGNHIASNSLTTGLFAAGAVKAGNVDIDAMLTIDAIDAGFSMGKASPADFGPDGIYMGRSAKQGGGTGYGFLMQTTAASGLQRWIQSTPDSGLNIVNAAFALMLPTAGAQTLVTTSQTLTLPAGTKTISLTVLGAGGSGAVTPDATTPRAGGATTVKLYDGAVDTGIQWSSSGGAAGAAATGAGESSIMGTGGAAGQRIMMGTPDNRYYVTTPGGDGTGYGAGGGGAYGGAKGGGRATAVTVVDYNVASLAAPKLVITIGAAGTNTGSMGNGSPGVVKLQSQSEALIPAGVVPHRRSGEGQFVKAANATGGAIFPDLKPGIWMLQEDGGNGLGLNGVVIDAAGTTLKLANASSACFFAEVRPSISIGNANARTINWQFFSLKAQ